MDTKVLYKNKNDFPSLLKEINNCPEKIFCMGNLGLLKEKKVMAVVGSRKISQYGKRLVEMIVPNLAANDIVVVSGMALGVDAEAQRVCLEMKGKTIAVLASGVDVVSPKSNKWLYQQIIENNGLILSEYKNGTLPCKRNFLDRNRIISGLSLGVLVIEGDVNSGTLITAKYAAEQGREVMAFPGRIDEENSKAPNYLIKNGARLVTEVGDILEAI